MSRWPPAEAASEGIAVGLALGIDIGPFLQENLHDFEVTS